MLDAVRIAIIGAAGWAGRRHTQAFHSLSGRIVALVDPQTEVHALADAVGAVALDSPDQLDVDDVDLVVVSLPSSLQPSVSADLLRRGLRVLVEKPIGSSAANAAELSEIADVESTLMVGYTLHHHPVAQALAAWVASAQVISVSVRSAARKLAIDSWRATPAEGGVAVVNGIHAIEFAASLFPGDVTVQSVHQSNQLHRGPVADYTAATLVFSNGPLFRLETYWNPWEHTTGLNNNDWSLEIDVIAHEGRRVWRNWSLHAWDRLGSETVRHFPEVDLFVAQAKSALRFAAGDQPAVGYRQALRATQIADEVLRKSREES